jgi:ATP-binding cassette subfamily A (ABC1) protein 3
MILAFNIETFLEDDCYGAIVLLFFLYGWAIIPFSYLFGFVFKSYGNAQIVNFFLHFILGAIASLVIFILRLIESTESAGLAL